jgi:hypothetical protein
MPSNESPHVSHQVSGKEPARCSGFGPGHQVHWIQMRKSLHEDVGVPVRIHVDPDLAVVQFVFNDEPRLYWHHETSRIAAAIHGHEGDAVWRPRFHVLAIPSGERSSHLFNLARLDQVRPCCPGTVTG